MARLQRNMWRDIAGFAGVNGTCHVFSEGRMHAAGYAAGPSESIALDENGNMTHKTEFQHAAKLWFIDGYTGTVVEIEARLVDIPLEQLIMIAISLK